MGMLGSAVELMVSNACIQKAKTCLFTCHRSHLPLYRKALSTSFICRLPVVMRDIIVIDASFHSRKRRISLDFSCRFTLRFMVRDATRLRTVFHEIHMLFLVIRSEQNANTQIRYFSMMLVLCAYGCRATPSQLEKSMLACLDQKARRKASTHRSSCVL